MYLDGKVPCAGCKLQQDVKRFKAPTHFQPTRIHVECADCGSIFMAVLSNLKGGVKGKLRVQVTMVRKGELFKQMEAEEAAAASDTNENLVTQDPPQASVT